MVLIKINHYSRSWAYQDGIVRWFITTNGVLHLNSLSADRTFCEWTWQRVICERKSRLKRSFRRKPGRSTKHLFGNHIKDFDALPNCSHVWFKLKIGCCIQWPMNAHILIKVDTCVKIKYGFSEAINFYKTLHREYTLLVQIIQIMVPPPVAAKYVRCNREMHKVSWLSRGRTFFELSSRYTATVFGTSKPSSNPGHP